MKRFFDVFATTILLVLLSPVLIVVAFAVRITTGTPILFRQLRPGLGGKPFVIVKFRTMANASPLAALDDERRLTGLGKFLRSTSIDELPELWNVLKGDMSLVGPRPLMMEYLSRYSPEQARRHEVRPGITGWAQINGRNAITWEEKFRLDVWYVDHRSFFLDMRILLITIWRVLSRHGISSEGHATMPPFEGF